MKLSRFAVAILAIAASAVTALPASAATVINGDFETGTLAGWTHNTSGNGAWTADSGTTAPFSGNPIYAPPQGTFAALTDQTGPGSHILYQDIVLAPGQQHDLNLLTYYQNDSGTWITPNSLEINQANQQYRIDIMRPSAPIRSLAPSDVLANVYRTQVGDPMQRPPFAVNFDLSPFAGQTVRLRFAAVQTQFFFRVGVDNVKVNSTTSDSDGDGIVDTSDNCPSVPNPGQENNDADAQGDACDADDDNDGVNDGSDNCQFTSNPGQENSDADAQGDACDPDDDNDGVADGSDNCQTTPNPDQADNDGDGVGTACDSQELPSNKDQCKKDGWKLWFFANGSRFKNQGDCVSYVATNGKNGPAGS